MVQLIAILASEVAEVYELLKMYAVDDLVQSKDELPRSFSMQYCWDHLQQLFSDPRIVIKVNIALFGSQGAI